MKANFLNQSICLSRIPEEAIRIDEQTGERWISITAALMVNPDARGNTYSVYITESKEKRLGRKGRIYVGKGKDFGLKQNRPIPY